LSLLDNFPDNLQARGTQKEILNEIQEKLKSGYRKILLSAPTGIGKSAIAMTMAKSYEKSFVVTSSKNLQDQYIDDFEMLVPVKGKSNFPCFKAMEQKEIDLQEYDVAFSQGLTCDKGECEEKSESGKKQNCKFKPRIQDFEEKTFEEIICPYYEQKYSALLAEHSVWNYHSYFQIVKYNQSTYGQYLNRNVSVFDEAHSIEDQIIQFVGIEILKKHIDESGIRISAYDLSDIDVIIKLMQDLAEFYGQQVKEIRQSRAYKENPDYARISKLDASFDRFARARYELASDPENFIINEPVIEKGEFKSLSIKPLDISKYVQAFFITPFQIFMSATVNKDAFCQNMGFSLDDIAFVDTPKSPFPLEHRKVDFLNTARLAYQSPKVVENRVWLKIDNILSHHKNQRGIILTSSRSRCEDIANNLSSKNKNRVRICHARNPDGKSQDDILKEHANSKDGVLVSSSLWQGVDLKDDLSRFQIIAKAPYPNYTEKWVESKMERYPLWYTSQTITKILQGFGRSIRSEQDWAETYVLDAAIEPLLNNSKNLVPKSYYDVFGWDVSPEN
jgi:ATP-dependent DNA helicase DinG